MTHNYYENWGALAKKFQEPIQQLAALNMKTLQGLNYLKPEEINKLDKPEELFERQINLAVENSHKALDYIQKYFQIYEKFLFSMLEEAKEAKAAGEKAVKN